MDKLEKWDFLWVSHCCEYILSFFGDSSSQMQSTLCQLLLGLGDSLLINLRCFFIYSESSADCHMEAMFDRGLRLVGSWKDQSHIPQCSGLHKLTQLIASSNPNCILLKQGCTLYVPASNRAGELTGTCFRLTSVSGSASQQVQLLALLS